LEYFARGTSHVRLQPEYAVRGSGYDQTQNGLGTWSKTKKATALRHLGMNQEQQNTHPSSSGHISARWFVKGVTRENTTGVWLKEPTAGKSRRTQNTLFYDM
jgi:hypothetical protein